MASQEPWWRLENSADFDEGVDRFVIGLGDGTFTLTVHNRIAEFCVLGEISGEATDDAVLVRYAPEQSHKVHVAARAVKPAQVDFNPVELGHEAAGV